MSTSDIIREVIAQVDPPRAPSIAGSESGLSLSSLSSLSSLHSISTVRDTIAPPCTDTEEFEEEEPTIRFSYSSSSQTSEAGSTSSSKRTRKGAWKVQKLELEGKASVPGARKHLSKRHESDQGPSTPLLHNPSISSISVSVSASNSSNASTKRKSRPKKASTVSKKAKTKPMKNSLKAEVISPSGPPESPYWRVLSGYNGPCEWPEIRSEGTSAGDVSVLI